MSNAQLTVAAVQLNPGADWQANLERALSRVRLAAEAGATFIALPEYFAYYGPAETWRGFANEHAPSVLAACKDLARQERISLLLGTILEPVPDASKVYNSSVLLGPDGEELARYKKIHLFDVETPTKTYRESQTLEAGSKLVVAEVQGFQVGLALCYDLRFPALFRELRRRGAELLCLPSAFTLHTGKDHWEVLLRARAIEDQCYVLAPALSGDCAGNACYGHSMIVDPWGLVTARAEDGEGMALARIHRSRLDEVRQAIPVMDHVRDLSGA